MSYWYSVNVDRPPVFDDYRRSDPPRKVDSIVDANLVGSMNDDGEHVVQIDIDTEHTYTPSSTPGHGHITITPRGGPITWRRYKKLLTALHDAGIIETGYYESAMRFKGTFLRPPHVKKAAAVVERLREIERSLR